MKEIVDVVREYVETDGEPESYAVISVKGDDATFMFAGESGVLLGLLPHLKKHIENSTLDVKSTVKH